VALRTPLGVTIVTWMMDPGEEAIVAQRFKSVLEKARKTADLRPRRAEPALAREPGMDNPIDEWNPHEDGLISQLSNLPTSE
jgi:hypothetical protein